MTNLFSCCDKGTGLVDALYLTLSKTSDTVSCNVLEKLGSHGSLHFTGKKNTEWPGLKCGGDCN